MALKAVPNITSRTEYKRLEETCLWVISLCKSKSLKEGICAHSPIIKLGLEDNLYSSNSLLSLYSKCFGVEKARHFFDKMPQKDVVSWTGILSAYVKNGNHAEALELFDLMIVSEQCPNEFTLSSILKSCSTIGDIGRGTRIQAYIIKHGLQSDSILGSNLIDLYSKWDCSKEAFEVFKYMDCGDTVSWTTMISAFVEDGKCSEALQLYIGMIKAGIPPNGFSFVKLLAASSGLGLKYGKLVHAHITVWGAELNVILITALMDMYFGCQKIEDAKKVSNLTTDYDVFLWTAIISGLGKNLRFWEAISAFRQMEKSGIAPNNCTYSSILHACSLIASLKSGQQIHSRVIKAGLEFDVFVGNALVDMYMKCSQLVDYALRAFRVISSPNVISWTSLISGFAEHGFEHDSFDVYIEMRAVGVKPNSYTLSIILKACSTVKSLNQTLEVHGYITKTNADHDIIVGNALIDAYAGLGMVDEAWHVVSMMSHRDAITYTSLATRMNQMGQHEKALNIIDHMCNDDVKLDGLSLPCFLSASSGLGTIVTGKQLHCYSVKSGLGRWISVSNGLIDLYGKCGCVDGAHKAFVEISTPDVVSWNGLISAYASKGLISSALSAFDSMRLAGVKPDFVTFSLVLNTCSHGKLVDLGLEYFQSMRETHKIEPQSHHYIFLVDLLGHAGRLEEALVAIQTMPFRPDPSMYKTLLGACREYRNVSLAEDVARRGLQLDPSDPAFYLVLANVYDDCGQFDLGEKVRRTMRDRGLRKNPGWSSIEIKNRVHFFGPGDLSHPLMNEIHEKIVLLITQFKNHGYHYQGNRDSSYHGEKLAVAFGLLNTPSKAPIRVIKDTQICGDCHNFVLLVTRLVDREIIVRCGNRFHYFWKGKCSCRPVGLL